jgi:hypothetical protein
MRREILRWKVELDKLQLEIQKFRQRLSYSVSSCALLTIHNGRMRSTVTFQDRFHKHLEV